MMLTEQLDGGYVPPSSFPPPLPYPDSTLFYFPTFLALSQADTYLSLLMSELPWQRRAIRIYGRDLMQPHLTAWLGDRGAHYTYSNTRHEPELWTATSQEIKTQLERHCRWRFNSVLANCYRDGEDSMGWHSDNEPELGVGPVIASLSLGAVRRFVMRRKDDHRQKFEYELAHGSLLIMAGTTQKHWQHSLPKMRGVKGPRVNLTYRWICQHS